jgi:hypothetical protein
MDKTANHGVNLTEVLAKLRASSLREARSMLAGASSGIAMVGVIRKRDVLRHPVATLKSFGWRVFLRALRAGPHETFLSLVAEIQAAEDVKRCVPPLLESAIALELRTMHLYEGLRARFANEPATERFFASLARQERSHAELLRVCAQASRRAPTDARRLAPLAHMLAPLQARMARAESSLASDIRRSEALRLVVEIESSEINRLFDGLLAVNGSPFVQSVRAFQTATNGHFAYLRHVLPTLDPGIEAECHELVA